MSHYIYICIHIPGNLDFHDLPCDIILHIIVTKNVRITSHLKLFRLGPGAWTQQGRAARFRPKPKSQPAAPLPSLRSQPGLRLPSISMLRCILTGTYSGIDYYNIDQIHVFQFNLTYNVHTNLQRAYQK